MRARRRCCRRHAVIVLIDRLDLATARAIQYARTLTPDSLRIVHFAVDPKEPATLGARVAAARSVAAASRHHRMP